MVVWATPTQKALMTKLAIVLLVLGAFFLFVDHQHRLLAHDIYCRIGAGELRKPRPGVQNQYCLHGSVWDAIMGHIYTWYHDSNP